MKLSIICKDNFHNISSLSSVFCGIVLEHPSQISEVGCLEDFQTHAKIPSIHRAIYRLKSHSSLIQVANGGTGGGVTKILGFEKAGEGGRGGSFEKLKMLLEEIRGYFSENL